MSLESLSKEAGTRPIKEPALRIVAFESRSSDGQLRHREELVDHMAGALMLLFMENKIHGLSFKKVFDELERDLLIKALMVFNCHQVKTAKFLGLLPSTLGEKLKKHRIAIEFKASVAEERPQGGDRPRGSGFMEVRVGPRNDQDKDETRELPLP